MTKGFISESKKHKSFGIPIEDSYKFDISGDIIVVADGVTRDPCEQLPNDKGDFSRDYPRPSPASIVSGLYTEHVVQFLKDKDNVSEEDVRMAFQRANRAIGEWNFENIPKPDYLTKDLAGCVASTCFLDRLSKKAYIGYISDCGVAILDSSGEVKFKTSDEGPSKNIESIESIVQENGGWNSPKARKVIRKDVRNNSNGGLYKKIGFGVLTGEDSAMDFVRTFAVDITVGDIILVYSDGMEEVLFNSSTEGIGDLFPKLLSGNSEEIRSYCDLRVKNEGTLVYTRA